MTNRAQPSPPFVTTDIKLAGLALALHGRLVGLEPDPRTRRLVFSFADVPEDLPERVFSDSVTISARDYIRALEDVHQLLLRHRERAGAR